MKSRGHDQGRGPPPFLASMLPFGHSTIRRTCRMERELSTPLNEPPGFLSTISMVVDDRSAIIERLIQAERKSPSRYEPAKALFCRVLEGDLSVAQAIALSNSVADSVERKCAIEILEASKEFLAGRTPARVGLFPPMCVSIPNGLKLNVSPVLFRHLDPERLMVLHFWRTPLSDWQLSAAGAILRLALLQHQPKFADCGIDFISVPLPEFAPHRRFEHYSWIKLKPLNDEDLQRFWKQFCQAWSAYKSRAPREIRRRRPPDMFARR
jgi:hypothetical protein